MATKSTFSVDEGIVPLAPPWATTTASTGSWHIKESVLSAEAITKLHDETAAKSIKRKLTHHPEYLSWHLLEKGMPGLARRRERGYRQAWKLDGSILLAQTASDFYLLMALNKDFSENRLIETKFLVLTNKLAELFCNYLNMTIGGELRHCKIHTEDGGIFRYIVEANPLIVPLIQWLPSYTNNGSSRQTQWSRWRRFQAEYGVIPSLETALFLYENLAWASGYGGYSWAKITKTTIDYLKGSMSKVYFIDTTFALHHNGSIVFDKIWNIYRIMNILDFNLNSDLKALAYNASPDVQELYENQYKKGRWSSCTEAKRRAARVPHKEYLSKMWGLESITLTPKEAKAYLKSQPLPTPTQV